MATNWDDPDALNIGSSDGNAVAPVGDVVSPSRGSSAAPVLPERYNVQGSRPAGQGGWRRPGDGLGDQVSRDTAMYFDTPDAKDQARQEFAAEADILSQLRRFGVSPTNSRIPSFADVDYDVDLLRAHELVRQARAALGKLPAEVLEKHGGPDGVLAAIERGELTELLEEPALKNVLTGCIQISSDAAATT